MPLFSIEEVSSQKNTKKKKKKNPHIIICLMYIFSVDEFPYKKKRNQRLLFHIKNKIRV